MMKFSQPIPRNVLAVAVGLILALSVGYAKETGVAIGLGSQPVAAQTIRAEGIAEIVYQRFPDIPKNNEYLRQDTGQVDADNTLVSRLVRYHQDIKKRATRFRLDWKLTLADYLGVNEPIKPDHYPGQSSLKTNPMESDVKAIRSLNRRQREELVEVLVSTYKIDQKETQSPNSNSNPSSQPVPQSSPEPEKPSSPSISKPGDAQLLMP